MSTKPTLTQQWAFAIAPKPTSALSFFSAGYVLRSILKSKERQKKLYHRIVAGMSSINMLQSVCYFIGTWAIPAGTPYTIGAVGTEATCSAQGFLIIFNLTATIYYCSLSLISLLNVCNDFKQTAIAKYEPLFHFCWFAFPTAMAIYGLYRHYFNPGYSWCYFNAYPIDCERSDDIPCIYGQGIDGYRATIMSAVVFCFLFATAAMIATCFVVRRKERKAPGLVGKKQYLQRALGQRSRIAVRQAALYLLAFYAIYLFQLIGGVLWWLSDVRSEVIFRIIIVGDVFSSLQGFLNMVVYVATCLETKRVGGELARQNDFTDREPPPATRMSYFKRMVQEKARRGSSIMGRSQNSAGTDFSIFDGAIDPSSPWAAYLDDEGEGEGEGEGDNNEETDH